MPFSERHFGGQFRPSDALNEAFTPVMFAFRDNVEDATSKDTAEKPKLRKCQIAESTTSIFSRSEYSKYPHVFARSTRQMSLAEYNELLDYQLNIKMIVPMSEYGEGWSQRLLSSGIHLLEAAHSDQSAVNVRNEAFTLNEEHSDALRYTYRGKSHQFGEDELSTGPIETHSESFVPTTIAAGHLTAYKVPGYEDAPERLLQDLTNQGILSQFALIINPSENIRILEGDAMFVNPTVTVDSNGTLAINRDIINYFSTIRKASSVKLHAQSKPLDRDGCPLARKLPGYKESAVDVAGKLVTSTIHNLPAIQ